jgi:hypothetical protein
MELEDNKTWSKAINRKRKQQNHGKKWRKNGQTLHVVKLKFKKCHNQVKGLWLRKAEQIFGHLLKMSMTRKILAVMVNNSININYYEQLSFKSSHWTQKVLDIMPMEIQVLAWDRKNVAEFKQ